MGLALSFLPFLDACKESNTLLSPMLALGDFKFHESKENLEIYSQTNGYQKLSEDYSARSFFLERYGIESYQDCDLHERGDFQIDLGKTIPGEFVGKFFSILNAGTIEHIFNQQKVMENLHDLIPKDGSFIHIAPVTWFNHAFYNLNPFLFRETAKANDYDLLVEAFHSPIPLFGESPSLAPFCYVTKSGGTNTKYFEGIEELFNAPLLPARMLYMSALRKNSVTRFEAPVEITLIPPEIEQASVSLPESINASIALTISPSPVLTEEQESKEASGGNEAFFTGLPTSELPVLSHLISGDSGHAYSFRFQTHAGRLFSKFAKDLPITVLEDGNPLITGAFQHSEIRNEGAGRCSMWNEQFYFSSSDNSDPRTNGRSYSIMVPAYVSFLEKLPPGGILKFQV